MMKMMTEPVINVAENLKMIRDKMDKAYIAAQQINPNQPSPKLVAVSKTKSVVMIKRAYDAGQRDFGENYTKELLLKANDKDLNTLCPEIRWHYIGTMQRTKISQIIRMPTLHMLQTLQHKEVADAINTRWTYGSPLNVMVQVNTSGEESKSGVMPENCVEIAKHIYKNCDNLRLCGLMTIGAWGHNYKAGENPDFTLLSKCRDDLCSSLDIPKEGIELSMGMSADFEEAIKSGSSYIRVGSSIFGPRDYGNTG